MLAITEDPGAICEGLRPTFGGAAPAIAYHLIQAITGAPPVFDHGEEQ